MFHLNLPERFTELGFYAMTHDTISVIVPPTVLVTAGEFLMGADLSNPSADAVYETPQHRVFLDSYLIGKYPVTVAEYACAVDAGAVPIPGVYEHPERFPGSIPWETQLQRLDHPVCEVPWEVALIYLKWLSHMTEVPWRFPTEAEWEKSARGTDGRQYPWGEIWHESWTVVKDENKNWGTGPIGISPQARSPYGVEDLMGNLWEMTSTAFRQYPYTTKDGRESLDLQELITLRGGSWIDVPPLRVTVRDESRDGPYTGFRLACSIPRALINTNESTARTAN